MAHVYWIRHPEHVDVFAEGYVGVTTLGVGERFKRHQAAARLAGRRQVVCNALRKYGDELIVDTLVEASEDYCYWLESRLRPAGRLGWNLAIGGRNPGSGRKNSPEHIAKVAAANRGLKRSPEQVAATSVRMKALLTFDRPWQHPYSNKHAWSLSPEVFEASIAIPGIGARRVASMFDISRDVAIKLLRELRSGWNPKQDMEFLSWQQKFKEAQWQPTACIG